MDRRLAALLPFVMMAMDLPAEERPSFMLAGIDKQPVIRSQVQQDEDKYEEWFYGAVAQDGNRAMISYNQSKAETDRYLAECKERGWFFFAFPSTDRSKRKEVIQVVAQGGKLRLIRDKPPKAKLIVQSEVRYASPVQAEVVYTETPRQAYAQALPLSVPAWVESPTVGAPPTYWGNRVQSGCVGGNCPQGRP